jgi:hypothetical protein
MLAQLQPQLQQLRFQQAQIGQALQTQQAQLLQALQTQQSQGLQLQQLSSIIEGIIMNRTILPLPDQRFVPQVDGTSNVTVAQNQTGNAATTAGQTQSENKTTPNVNMTSTLTPVEKKPVAVLPPPGNAATTAGQTQSENKTTPNVNMTSTLTPVEKKPVAVLPPPSSNQDKTEVIPPPTQTPALTPAPTPTLAANRTTVQSSAASGQRPINETEGNSLGVVDINASTQQEPDNVAENVLDSDQNTRWSGEGNGTWIQVDFGSEKPIKSIGLAWYKGDSRKSNFDISVSNTTESNDFIKVFSGQSSGRTDSIERYDTKGVVGQYLRITNFGNTDSNTSSRDWAGITTLEIYT